MADSFRFLDPETLSRFESAAYAGALKVLDGLVDAYRKSHPMLEPRYTRAVIGGAMLSVGIEELKRNGFTLGELQKKLGEAWSGLLAGNTQGKT